MKCQDVRRALSFLADGELSLTEWAIVQGHVRECAECGTEVERVRAQAAGRTRARRRRVTAAILAATVVLLGTGAGGAYMYQRGSLPDLPRWGSAQSPPRTVTPGPGPEPVAPAAPPSMPPPVRSRPTVEPPRRAAPPPVAPPPEPMPRAAAAAPAQERMPTQARPAAALRASPDAEAMPTQAPAGSGARRR